MKFTRRSRTLSECLGQTKLCRVEDIASAAMSLRRGLPSLSVAAKPKITLTRTLLIDLVSDYIIGGSGHFEFSELNSLAFLFLNSTSVTSINLWWISRDFNTRFIDISSKSAMFMTKSYQSINSQLVYSPLTPQCLLFISRVTEILVESRSMLESSLPHENCVRKSNLSGFRRRGSI